MYDDDVLELMINSCDMESLKAVCCLEIAIEMSPLDDFNMNGSLQFIMHSEGPHHSFFDLTADVDRAGDQFRNLLANPDFKLNNGTLLFLVKTACLEELYAGDEPITGVFEFIRDQLIEAYHSGQADDAHEHIASIAGFNLPLSGDNMMYRLLYQASICAALVGDRAFLSFTQINFDQVCLQNSGTVRYKVNTQINDMMEGIAKRLEPQLLTTKFWEAMRGMGDECFYGFIKSPTQVQMICEGQKPELVDRVLRAFCNPQNLKAVSWILRAEITNSEEAVKRFKTLIDKNEHF